METQEILDLFEKFEKSSLSEIAIKKGDVEVMMKKEAAGYAVGAPEHQIVMKSAPVQQAAAETHEPAEEGIETINSPMVGTFFRAPASDAPPFVDVGAKVRKGQTVCVLEAMKLMNELETEFDCEIVKILVENGKMVEFGTPLFEVKRT